MGKIVRFSDSCSYITSRHELHCGEAVHSLPKKESELLDYLIDYKGITLTKDQILDAIWGIDYVPKGDNIYQCIVDTIRKLRKRDKAIDAAIGTKYGEGYCLRRESITIEEEWLPETEIPYCLTKMMPHYADESMIIHRNKEIADLAKQISNGKTAIMITGFGGMGKTSLAQVLFSKVSNQFKHVGWIEYRENCQHSILESFDLFEDIVDSEKRWIAITKTLKNDLSQKILFIDNVDNDNRNRQDPENDVYLQEICGWPNTTVVLTSRLDELIGYKSYHIGSLGDAEEGTHKKTYCLDLFYYYFKQEELAKKTDRLYETEAGKLVQLASYHTYAIEVLARSAKYCDDFPAYFRSVLTTGFKFPSQIIKTSRERTYDTAAAQMKKLFDLSTRTPNELQILRDFSVLPNMALAPNELIDWMGIGDTDWSTLVSRGWLIFQNGVLMHPIMKETLRLDYTDGKAPIGTADKLTEQLRSRTFIARQEPFITVMRKLTISENALRHIRFPSKEYEADVLVYLGFCYLRRVKKLASAESYLKKALCLYQEWDGASKEERDAKIAEAYYWLGYIESAMTGKRSIAEEHLKTAVNMFKELYEQNPNKYTYWLAKCYDHYAYVLADKVTSIPQAEALLNQALQLWETLCKGRGNEEELLYEVATTYDNLGYILSKQALRYDDAEQNLQIALKMRKRLYDNDESYTNDLSWTYHNLGELYSQDATHFDDAVNCFREALQLREERHRRAPGMYENNIVWTCTRMGEVLADMNDFDEAEKVCRRAMELIDEIKDRGDFYADEAYERCLQLSETLSMYKAKKAEVR